MVSTMATCAATAAGCAFGKLTVALPRRMREVASARLAMKIRHEVIVSQISVTCSPMNASV
jgi:hypothetical protein